MILGLHGKMGSGKNEAAKRLALIAPPVIEVSFARRLKESAAALLGCTVDDLEAWKNDPEMYLCVCDHVGPMMDESQTVRSFLQRYGTEAHRDIFGQDFWLDAALPMRGTHSPAPLRSVDTEYARALYVVTDVRFPNEAQRIRDLGGTVVRIIGPNEDTGNHPSEQPIECDYSIDNTIRDDGYASLDAQLRFDVLGIADAA